jgi:hypothetical protein
MGQIRRKGTNIHLPSFIRRREKPNIFGIATSKLFVPKTGRLNPTSPNSAHLQRRNTRVSRVGWGWKILWGEKYGGKRQSFFLSKKILPLELEKEQQDIKKFRKKRTESLSARKPTNIITRRRHDREKYSANTASWILPRRHHICLSWALKNKNHHRALAEPRSRPANIATKEKMQGF